MSDSRVSVSRSAVGDITGILNDHGVADLSWLNVDEEEYRAGEALPKQNLDVIPELQRALTRVDGDDVPHLIPYKPHTIVNRNPLSTPTEMPRNFAAPIRNRVASLVMQNVPSKDIFQRLHTEFAPSDIRMATQDIRDVLQERGLLGNVYVNSEHFPRCHQSQASDKAFVNQHGKKALFVLAKSDCAGCVHNQCGRCSVFRKRLADNVPYTGATLAHYAPTLSTENRPVQLASTAPMAVRQALKLAFGLAPAPTPVEGNLRVHTQQPKKATPISAQDVESFWDRQTQAAIAAPNVLLQKFARRMMNGYDDRQLLQASTHPELRALATQFGLLGHTYLDMDALGGCRATIDFIRRRTAAAEGDLPDFVVRKTAKCTICLNCSDGACAELCRIANVVDSIPTFDRRNFVRALVRAQSRHVLSAPMVSRAASRVSASNDWSSLISRVNLLKSQDHTPPAQYASAKVVAHYGESGVDLHVSTATPEKIRRTVSHLMNSGLSGGTLKNAILGHFSRQELQTASETGRVAARFDGVQGSYFVDPTAYPDYGSGCATGAEKFRKRGAPNLLASSGCTGCTLQTAPGWCSKYAKDLIRSVPDEIVAIARQAREESRKLPMLGPVETLGEKWELAAELPIDLGGPARTAPSMGFADRSIDP